jgi:hypothetical protein
LIYHRHDHGLHPAIASWSPERRESLLATVDVSSEKKCLLIEGPKSAEERLYITLID